LKRRADTRNPFKRVEGCIKALADIQHVDRPGSSSAVPQSDELSSGALDQKTIPVPRENSRTPAPPAPAVETPSW